MKGVFIMQNKPIIYQPGVVPQEITVEFHLWASSR